MGDKLGVKGVQFFWAVDLHVGNALARRAQDEVFVGLLLHRVDVALIWFGWGCSQGEKI